MKTLFVSVALLASITANADTLVKHTGEKIECEVQNVSPAGVTFVYKNEKATHFFSRYAVAKIIYDSGREETISQKKAVELSHYQDVIVTENPDDVAGLQELSTTDPVTDEKGKVHGYQRQDAASVRTIKKYAARRGAFIVLVQSDSDPAGMGEKRRLQKKAICYTY